MAVIATNHLDDPDVRGIVCNLRDVTERIEAALAAEAALRVQETARHDLERVTAAKSDFLRLLGHEFKTPLTVIAGNAELLERVLGDDAPGIESTRAIRDEAHRLARLIDDLLLLDQMEVAELVLRRQEVDLNALVEETIGRLRGLAPEREFHRVLAPELQPIAIDPERIGQVLINLIGNAVKFSPSGGPVTVTTTPEPGGVLLSVRDEGVGIPPEALPTIFDRYRRAESGSAPGITGTGLGLTIVREIVRLHGGEVWAESIEGQGSTLHVRLPKSAGTRQH
jgi:signal transduction histidine kinase